MKKKILILGINGFSGQFLKKYLEEEKKSKFRIFGCDIKKSNEVSFDFFMTDLGSYKNVKELIKEIKPDYIINCAGIYDKLDYRQYYNTNVLVSNNIFHSILNIRNIDPRVLVIGSSAEYGQPVKLPVLEQQKLNPVSIYGMIKVAQTYHALYYSKNFDIKVLIVRPFNLLGPGLSESLSISSFCSQIYKNKKGNKSIIMTGNLNAKRDFIDVRDAVRAYLDIVLYGRKGEVYNVCTGKSRYMKEVVLKTISLSGLDVHIKNEKARMRKNDIPDIYGNHAKLTELSGWKPEISLDSSLKSMIEYWKKG